jgi:hypothetical protein
MRYLRPLDADYLIFCEESIHEACNFKGEAIQACFLCASTRHLIRRWYSIYLSQGHLVGAMLVRGRAAPRLYYVCAFLGREPRKMLVLCTLQD